MVTGRNERTIEYFGLSTDIKPVENYIGNGSIFIEVDTNNIFMFDEENKIWYPFDIFKGINLESNKSN